MRRVWIARHDAHAPQARASAALSTVAACVLRRMTCS